MRGLTAAATTHGQILGRWVKVPGPCRGDREPYQCRRAVCQRVRPGASVGCVASTSTARSAGGRPDLLVLERSARPGWVSWRDKLIP